MIVSSDLYDRARYLRLEKCNCFKEMYSKNKHLENNRRIVMSCVLQCLNLIIDVRHFKSLSRYKI